jgi:hypothetical protein
LTLAESGPISSNALADASISFNVTERTMGSIIQGNAAPAKQTGAALPEKLRRTASAAAAWAWTVATS